MASCFVSFVNFMSDFKLCFASLINSSDVLLVSLITGGSEINSFVNLLSVK